MRRCGSAAVVACLVLRVLDASAQTATVTGRVTDSLTSAPLAGVTVGAVYPGGSNVAAAEAVTDAGGQYSIAVAPGSYNVRATKAGYRLEWFDDVKCPIVCTDPPRWTLSPGSALTADLALDPLASISGTLVDAGTLAPLVSTSDRSFMVGLSEGSGQLTWSDSTDASGQYTIDGLLPGTYFVKVQSAPGYVLELHNNLPCIAADCPPTAGTPIVLGVGTAVTIDFALDAGGVITGAVRRAANGSALPSMLVTIYNSSTSLVRSVSAAANGTYRVDGLAAGSYFARVLLGSSPPQPVDYIPELFGGLQCPSNECPIASGAPIAVTPGATTAGIDFALDRGGTISGTVVAAGVSTPLASVQIVAMLGAAPIASAVTDAGGQYVIRGLPAASYRVRTSTQGSYVNAWYGGLCVGCGGAPIAVAVGPAADVGGIDFSLTTGGGITGRLSLPCLSGPTDGLGWPSVEVYSALGVLVRSAISPPQGPLSGCPTTDYTVSGLAPGQYYVLFRDYPNDPFNPFFVSTGDLIDELYHDIACVTEDCDVRRGTPVTVTSGSVTSGIDVQLTAGHSFFVSDPGASSGITRSMTLFDARGVALAAVLRRNLFTSPEFVGLPTGTYYLRVADSLFDAIPCADCPPTSGRPIVIAPDTGSFRLNVPTAVTWRVSGTVRDASNLGLSTITVELHTDAGRVVGSAVTDLAGNYFVAVLPGTYFARTRNDRGYVDEVFADVLCASCDVRNGAPVIVQSADISGIDFSLAAGGTILGLVTDSGGTVVADVPVALFDAAGQPVERALTGTDGSFRVTVPTGSYRARAEGGAANGWEVFNEQPCTTGSCDVTGGSPIVATAGATIPNINFTLPGCTAMTLSPPLLASGVVGRSYRQVFSVSGGTNPVSFQPTGGALPSGVTLGASNGVLEGTPTVSGRHEVTVSALDAAGCATARTYTLDVQECAFTLSPTSATVAATGGTMVVAIGDGCGSQAVIVPPFVTVRSTTPTQVVMEVQPNPAASPRTAAATIGRRVFTVRQAGVTSQPPFGALDAPADGAHVSGSIAVGGWALDDLEVSRVQIFRDPVGGEPPMQMFIGTAVFIAGARPDVARAYPTYPLNNRAGWGFLILTNMLPNQGNGTFRIYAYAEDAEGSRALLGAKTIVVNNATAMLPFGAIDTPGQGETIGGSAYLNWGWALTPQPKIIPTDGSTIQVYVDGVPQGHPIYNLFRPDVAGLFPGLANSGGPVGYRVLDTTALAEGQHTIAWVVTDSRGAANGIGSRYFSVANSADAQALALASSAISAEPAETPVTEPVAAAPAIAVVAGPDRGRRVASLTSAPAAEGRVVVLRGDAHARLVPPDEQGRRSVTLRVLERLELALSDTPSSCAGTWAGYLVDDGQLSDLPVGAAIDPNGTFYWQPGPGFLGVFELLFVRTACDGGKERLFITVTTGLR